MGATVEMLKTHPAHVFSAKSGGSSLLIALRFVVGYGLAVGTGAIAFAIVAHLIPDTAPLLPLDGQSDVVGSIIGTAFVYFFYGLIFGIPYTVLGSLVFQFCLPRTMAWFLAVGALCPAVAILLMFSTLGDVTFDLLTLKLLLATLPAGLVAAYMFGAVGFARGFGRWRFA